MVQASKFSIHDISRLRSTKKGEYYRLNMPFELGVDFGCRLFAQSKTQTKVFLILEKGKYAYLRALSDLSGVDIKSHGNKPEELVRQVRNWFVENELNTAVSAATIWEDFNEFMADFYQKRALEGFSAQDLQMMPVPEYVNFVRSWLSLEKKAFRETAS